MGCYGVLCLKVAENTDAGLLGTFPLLDSPDHTGELATMVAGSRASKESVGIVGFKVELGSLVLLDRGRSVASYLTCSKDHTMCGAALAS
jgi:hypothetical protein